LDIAANPVDTGNPEQGAGVRGIMMELLHMDCMEYMKGCEDNAFDLAIVDPPYREENQPDQWMRAKGGLMDDFGKLPDADYFSEIGRVSKEFICWGGNYFTEYLPSNNNWVIWYKMNDGVHFSMAEMAYSTIRKNVKVFHHLHNGAPYKIHPTQKPVKLYEWLLTNYAKPTDRILDTHLGSGSSAIAAHYFGCDFVGMEIDADYYNAAVKRFEAETAQLDIFG